MCLYSAKITEACKNVFRTNCMHRTDDCTAGTILYNMCYNRAVKFRVELFRYVVSICPFRIFMSFVESNSKMFISMFSVA